MQYWKYFSFTCNELFYTDNREKLIKFIVEDKNMNGSEYLNYLGAQGWELVCAVPITIGSNESFSHVRYILKKPAI